MSNAIEKDQKAYKGTSIGNGARNCIRMWLSLLLVPTEHSVTLHRGARSCCFPESLRMKTAELRELLVVWSVMGRVSPWVAGFLCYETEWYCLAGHTDAENLQDRQGTDTQGVCSLTSEDTHSQTPHRYARAGAVGTGGGHRVT